MGGCPPTCPPPGAQSHCLLFRGDTWSRDACPQPHQTPARLQTALKDSEASRAVSYDHFFFFFFFNKSSWTAPRGSWRAGGADKGVLLPKQHPRPPSVLLPPQPLGLRGCLRGGLRLNLTPPPWGLDLTGCMHGHPVTAQGREGSGPRATGRELQAPKLTGLGVPGPHEATLANVPTSRSRRGAPCWGSAQFRARGSCRHVALSKPLAPGLGLPSWVLEQPGWPRCPVHTVPSPSSVGSGVNAQRAGSAGSGGARASRPCSW